MRRIPVIDLDTPVTVRGCPIVFDPELEQDALDLIIAERRLMDIDLCIPYDVARKRLGLDA